MFLRILCRPLQGADGRMTTSITLVLAEAFVAGAPPVGHSRSGDLDGAMKRPAPRHPEPGR